MLFLVEVYLREVGWGGGGGLGVRGFYLASFTGFAWQITRNFPEVRTVFQINPTRLANRFSAGDFIKFHFLNTMLRKSSMLVFFREQGLVRAGKFGNQYTCFEKVI